jgi:hypothetical protein
MKPSPQDLRDTGSQDRIVISRYIIDDINGSGEKTGIGNHGSPDFMQKLSNMFPLFKKFGTRNLRTLGTH